MIKKQLLLVYLLLIPSLFILSIRWWNVPAPPPIKRHSLFPQGTITYVDTFGGETVVAGTGFIPYMVECTAVPCGYGLSVKYREALCGY